MLLDVSQKSILPPGKNRRSPPPPVLMVTPLAVPWKATTALILTLKAAFSVRRGEFAQATGAVTSMVTAPEPVFTVTSELASKFSRSTALRIAPLAVGVHAPAE